MVSVENKERDKRFLSSVNDDDPNSERSNFRHPVSMF